MCALTESQHVCVCVCVCVFTAYVVASMLGIAN